MAETDWKYLQYNVETGQKRTGDGPSGGPSSLADLDDTSISNPSNGQILGYDGSAGKWKNVAAPAGSVTDVKLDNQSVVDQNGVAQLTTPNIDALGKTAISNPANGEMLGYDGTEGKWKNVSAPGGNVDDVYVNGESVLDENKIAQVTSYKEVTLAEYMALPDSKLSDGVMYCIKDVGSANQFPPLIYSDEEREVGVWKDGKPLYQKTVQGTLTVSGTDFTFSHGISNLDEVIEAYGIFHLTNGQCMVMNIASDLQHWGLGMNTFDASNIYGYIGSDLVSLVNKIVVNVQYTKTTDTAGSGTWTTQGAIAHHYSTTEHIIGTWIDGKPLYEKTVSFGALPNNTSKYVPHGVQNADFINIVNAFASYANGYYHTQIPITSLYDAANGASIVIIGDDILIQTRTDMSGYSTCYITIQYTKTTD